MVFLIDSYTFAHKSRQSDGRCLVYNRVGLVGRVIQGGSEMLYFRRGCYAWEIWNGE
jgi:hypothetical protein